MLLPGSLPGRGRWPRGPHARSRRRGCRGRAVRLSPRAFATRPQKPSSSGAAHMHSDEEPALRLPEHFTIDTPRSAMTFPKGPATRRAPRKAQLVTSGQAHLRGSHLGRARRCRLVPWGKSATHTTSRVRPVSSPPSAHCGEVPSLCSLRGGTRYGSVPAITKFLTRIEKSTYYSILVW
jgi:hypothetical protein